MIWGCVICLGYVLAMYWACVGHVVGHMFDHYAACNTCGANKKALELRLIMAVVLFEVVEAPATMFARNGEGWLHDSMLHVLQRRVAITDVGSLPQMLLRCLPR